MQHALRRSALSAFLFFGIFSLFDFRHFQPFCFSAFSAFLVFGIFSLFDFRHFQPF